jgi:DNA-binding beta-propeller fold protein YncE
MRGVLLVRRAQSETHVKHILVAALLLCSVGVSAQEAAPLRLVQTIELPEVPAGPYADHMAIDLGGKRLFTTPQANHAVDVLDLASGKVLHTIAGLGNPHAIFYDSESNRLFVTDSIAGALRVFDAASYAELKPIALQPGADGIAYDPATALLYVTNGGDEAGKDYSLVSIVDVKQEVKIADIRVESDSLEAMAIDQAANRLYINLPESSSIAVVDLARRTVIATWKLTKGKKNMAFALDAAHHRLYTGCRDTDVRGSIVVVDTETGKEIDRLPIGGWVDSLFFDPVTARIYASCGVGEVFTYRRESNGVYKRLEETDTAVMAKTSLYSPELHRLYVAVPHLGGTVAKVLVFAAD